jgi:hypothetical protein
MSVTATVEIERTPADEATGSRIGAVAGLVFALCFFLGVAMLEPPESASDRELVAW